MTESSSSSRRRWSGDRNTLAPETPRFLYGYTRDSSETAAIRKGRLSRTGHGPSGLPTPSSLLTFSSSLCGMRGDPVRPSICDRMNEYLAGFIVDRRGYDSFSPGGDRPQTGCYFVTDRSRVRRSCQTRDGPFNFGQRPISRDRPGVIEDSLGDDSKITGHQRMETNAVRHVCGSVPIVARAAEKT